MLHAFVQCYKLIIRTTCWLFYLIAVFVKRWCFKLIMFLMMHVIDLKADSPYGSRMLNTTCSLKIIILVKSGDKLRLAKVLTSVTDVALFMGLSVSTKYPAIKMYHRLIYHAKAGLQFFNYIEYSLLQQTDKTLRGTSSRLQNKKWMWIFVHRSVIQAHS